jgi:hypothetical protein
MRLFTLQHLGVVPASQKLESMHRYPTPTLELVEHVEAHVPRSDLAVITSSHSDLFAKIDVLNGIQ